MPTCGVCGRANAEDFAFCPACGTPLLFGASAGEVRKTVTIVFCDLTGSTPLGERLDAESFRRVLSRYFEAMRLVIERHGGLVEKFIGDAVMAVFGIPKVHEDDPLRAVRAAAEMRQALTSLNKELERDHGVTIDVRIGVNTGEVIVGEQAGGQMIATGDAVNVAARLEQHASPGEVLLGDATLQLVRDGAHAEPIGLLDLKGKREAVRAWRLLSVRDISLPVPRHLNSPMVGRDRQLGLLRQWFGTAIENGACQLFTILGPAGVGKSRLVAEFIAGIGEQARVVRGRCLPYGEGITYYPVIEAVKAAIGVADSNAPETVEAGIRAMLDGDEHADLVCSYLLQLLGIGEALAAGGDELHWAIRRFFEASAQEQPLVIVFDDIHWGQPMFLDLVEHIADWSRGSPILLLCMARTDLLDARPSYGGGKLNAATVSIEPLTDEQSELLITNLLGSSDLPADVTERIVETAEGNPLFVEQMIAMLIDEGRILHEGHRWTAASDTFAITVPPSIQALLAARLDQLTTEERRILEVAAVAGKTFSIGAVRELAPDELRIGIPNTLMTLVRKELIRAEPMMVSGEDAFRFRHLLVRDAAYEAISKARRAELHERFADWLERVAGDGVSEYQEVVGYHLERARSYLMELGPADEGVLALGRRAASNLAASSRRALVRLDMHGAANLLGRAVAVVPHEDPGRTELLTELGAALNRCDQVRSAEDVLDEAVELATVSGDVRLEARARLDRWWARRMAKPDVFRKEMRQDVERTIPTLERLDDDLGLTKAWQLLAISHADAFEFRAMEAPLKRALEHARRAGDPLEEAEVLMPILNAALSGPLPAPVGIRQCDETARKVKDRRIEARAMGIGGILRAMIGQFTEGRELLARSRAIDEDLGLAHFPAPSMGLWELEMLAGNPAAAERELETAFPALDVIDVELTRSVVAGMLAHALCAQRRFREAEPLADISMRLAGGALVQQVLSRCAKAKVLAAQARFTEAQDLAQESVALAEATDALNLHGDALVVQAEIRRQAGFTIGAASAAERALKLYEAKQNLVSAESARSLLRACG